MGTEAGPSRWNSRPERAYRTPPKPTKSEAKRCEIRRAIELKLEELKRAKGEFE